MKQPSSTTLAAHDEKTHSISISGSEVNFHARRAVPIPVSIQRHIPIVEMTDALQQTPLKMKSSMAIDGSTYTVEKESLQNYSSHV